MWFPINALVMLILAFGIIFLQIYLSKKENKWFGLFMPIISFAFSLINVLALIMHDPNDLTRAILAVFITFLLYNVPTIILTVIYFTCRENLKKNKELDKIDM